MKSILTALLLTLSFTATADEKVLVVDILNSLLDQNSKYHILVIRTTTDPEPTYTALYFSMAACLPAAQDLNKRFSNVIASCEKKIKK